MAFYKHKPIAHRGLHNSHIPENSMKAFELAIEYGYAIELDVQLSKDGHVIVFHDWTLARMTGSNGSVEQFSLQSLRSLKLLDSRESIPTLKEVISLVAGRVPLVIEIKCLKHDGKIERKVMELLTLSGYEGEFAIQSFNPYSLKWIRDRYENTVLGLLVTSDFSDVKINYVQRKALQYMLFHPLIRPDYIGLDYENFTTAQFLMIRNLTNSNIVFWTIRSEENYYECLEFCDNVIFEGFFPPVSKI